MVKVSIVSRVTGEKEPPHGTPFFAREVDTDDIVVAIVSTYGAFYFSSASDTVPVSFSSYEFYRENYAFVRAFELGESLTLTA